MRAIVVLLLAVLSGCPSDTVTREVDVPDTKPMDLPETGWVITFTGFYSDNENQTQEISGTDSNCFVRTHTLGAAIDYCGFTAYVGGESFSLDTDKYYAEGLFGVYSVQITGTGDAAGTVFHVDGYHPMLELEYDIDYVVTHTAEIDADGFFAPEPLRFASLPITPELFRPDLFQ